jgi:HEAT repeat protein
MRKNSSEHFFSLVARVVVLFASFCSANVGLAASDLAGKWTATYNNIREVWTISHTDQKWSVQCVYSKEGRELGSCHGIDIEEKDAELKFVRIYDKKVDANSIDNSHCTFTLKDGRIQFDIHNAKSKYHKVLSRSDESDAKQASNVAATPKTPDVSPANPHKAPSVPAPAASEKPETAGPNASRPRMDYDLLTAENYAKVQPGMTRDEVYRILGAARYSSQTSANEMTFGWRLKNDSKHKVEVRFRNGVVTSKSTNIDFHPAAAAESKTPAVKGARPAHVEKSSDDKLADGLAMLMSSDKHKQSSGLEFFANAPFNKAHADEVNRALLHCLRSKDPFVPDKAMSCLEKWATPDMTATFIGMLEKRGGKRGIDHSHLQTISALRILGRLKSPDAVAPVVAMLGDFHNRSEAINALREMGPSLVSAELQRRANDPNNEVRKAIVELLQEFGPGSPALKAFYSDLKSTNTNLRLGATQGIAVLYVHPRARKMIAQRLEETLADSDANIAAGAAKALVRWGAVENETALIAALARNSDDVRRYAATALQNFGTTKAIPSLEPLATARDYRIAAAANAALEEIRQRGEQKSP